MSKIRNIILAISLILLCLAFVTYASESIGLIKNVPVEGYDIARAFGMQVLKFEFSLPDGQYDIDCWVEGWSKGAKEPLRLTMGKSQIKEVFSKGNIIISILDVATNNEDKDKNIKITISKEYIHKGKQVHIDSYSIIVENPLYGLSNSGSETYSKEPIKLDKDINLFTILGDKTRIEETSSLEEAVAIHDKVLVFKVKFTKK